MIAGPHCSHVVQGWFIPGKSPIAVCDVHRQVWIDDRTGLRLSGQPDGTIPAHAEVREFWPSDLAKLFQAAGIPRQSIPVGAAITTSVTAARDDSKGPCIVSPKKGLIYHVRLASAGEDVLNLEATAETNRQKLHWFVDAACVGVSEPSASLLWKLQPGRHVIRAVDDLGRADSRAITVTAVE